MVCDCRTPWTFLLPFFSNEYPQHMFLQRNKKSIYQIPTLIKTYGFTSKPYNRKTLAGGIFSRGSDIACQSHDGLVFYVPFNIIYLLVCLQRNNSLVFDYREIIH